MNSPFFPSRLDTCGGPKQRKKESQYRKQKKPSRGNSREVCEYCLLRSRPRSPSLARPKRKPQGGSETKTGAAIKVGHRHLPRPFSAHLPPDQMANKNSFPQFDPSVA